MSLRKKKTRQCAESRAAAWETCPPQYHTHRKTPRAGQWTLCPSWSCSTHLSVRTFIIKSAKSVLFSCCCNKLLQSSQSNVFWPRKCLLILEKLHPLSLCVCKVGTEHGGILKGNKWGIRWPLVVLQAKIPKSIFTLFDGNAKQNGWQEDIWPEIKFNTNSFNGRFF